MKKLMRKTSVILSLIIMIGYININYLNVSADTIYNNVKKPDIKVEGPEILPRQPMEGQEIEIKYTLIPQPFQHNVPKSKEIVLVLDKSGSMKDNNKMSNLKVAAEKFIESLSKIDEKTGKPKVSDLKIGIIAYDKNGKIIQDLIQVTTADESLISNIDKLKKKIDGINADGGTNTGDGLRKGAYVLDKSDPNADKTIIFMGDGEPTYYTYTGWLQQKYYTTLDDTNKNVGGSGSSDTNGKCLEYATTIGGIIKSENYNVFSIGYGLGNENSSGNIKMKEIHKSMGGAIGGDNNTFFATDSGAIEQIFSQIADTLAKSYTFSDANLDIGLDDKFTAVDGFDINGVKVDPIVYELKDNYWYKAEPVEVIFKVKTNGSGDIPLFSDNYNNSLEYKDINGNIVKVTIPNPIINVKPYNVEEEKKLLISTPEQINCLIGDNISYDINVKHPNVDKIIYENVKFDISEGLPTILESKNNELVKEFGRIIKGDDKKSSYSLKVLDEESITVDNGMTYELKGKYSYLAKENSAQKEVNDEISSNINIKRGQVRVKIIDSQGNNIDSNVTVKLKSRNIDISSTDIEDGYIIFDTLPTDNYEVILSSIPNGYDMPEINNIVVRLDYSNNSIGCEFVLKGEGITSVDVPSITANLESDKYIDVTLGEEVELVYAIDAKPFEYDKMSNESKDVVLLIDKTTGKKDNKFKDIKESIKDELIEDFVSNNNVKMGIVSFDGSGNNESLELTPNVGLLENFIDDIASDENAEQGNITNALLEANRLLNEGYSSNKSIIMITFEDIKYYESKIDEVIKNNYNIFSVCIKQNKHTGEESISKLHTLLKGEKENYIISENNGNDIKEEVIKRLKLRLESQLVNRYIIKDLKLKIDLGNDLEYIQNKDSKVIEINIPDLIYNLNKSEKMYYPDPISDIKIKMKPKKIGNIEFGKERIITYINIYNDVIKKKIEVPKITVNESITDLYHGLYGGIKDSTVNIMENESGFEMLPEKKVTFGAKFLVGGNSTKFNLNVDKDLENVLLENIKIYKTVKNGSSTTLQELTRENGTVIRATNRGGKNFDISIDNIKNSNSTSSEKTEIVVIYTGTTNKGSGTIKYKNTIEFSNDNKKDVIIKIEMNNSEPPDLF